MCRPSSRVSYRKSAATQSQDQYTHNDRPTIRVDNLVFARTELGRLSSRRRRVARVQCAFCEGHELIVTKRVDGRREEEELRNLQSLSDGGDEIGGGAAVPDLARGRGHMMQYRFARVASSSRMQTDSIHARVRGTLRLRRCVGKCTPIGNWSAPTQQQSC